MSNKPPPNGKDAGNDPKETPAELIARLESLINAGKGSKEEMARLVRELRAAWDSGDLPANPPQTQPVNPAPGDNYQIGGGVGPGANFGEGTTYNDQVAGRDLVTTNVESGGTVIRAEKIETLVVPPSTKVGVGPDESAEAEPGPLSDAERAYLSRLLVTTNRVPLGELGLEFSGREDGIPEVRLDTIYVPLDTTTSQPAVGGKPEARVPVPVLDAAIRHRHLMILGDPGSGKSTFLNYLTLCLTSARLHPKRGALDRLNVPPRDGQRAAKWRHGPLLPVLVDLGEFAQDIPEEAKKGNADLLWRHILNQLAASNQGDFAKPLYQALQNGQCLVMLDGLDEVPEKTLRHIVRDSMADFADTHSRSRFIATCRVLSYTNPDWRLNSFPDMTLAPLSRSSIDIFINNWYAALERLDYMEPGWNKARADELRHAVCDLLDLAENPMLLTVMALVHTYKGTLPRERAVLYSDCVDLLLWNWQRAKEIGPGVWEKGLMDELATRKERIMNGLCDVAFQAHSAQGVWPDAAHIPEMQLLRILRDYLDGDLPKTQKFCDYVEKRAGLLVGKGEGAKGERMYSFPHRGFQEFLAARHLVNGRDFARRMADLAAQGDIWHEVLLLAVGYLVFDREDIYRPMDAANLLCLPTPPKVETDWRSAWWAAEILLIVGRQVAEGDKYVGQELVPRVIQRLVALVQEGHLSPRERAQAADVLGCLGDPRPGVCTSEPEMVRIEGGAFAMGVEAERHNVRLRPFYLARYPVTNAQFRRFAEKDYYDSAYWTAEGNEWRARTSQRRGLINHPLWGIANRPVTGLTWHEAIAYTCWLAKATGRPFRLSTEAEWERAATGMEGRKYPWGNRTSDDTANTQEAGIRQTTAVGIFPHDHTPEGVCDLGGNVWEWTSSLAKDYPYKAGDGRERLDQSGPRVLRGGSYDSPRKITHCTQRHLKDPNIRAALIGFRVAMNAG